MKPFGYTGKEVCLVSGKWIWYNTVCKEVKVMDTLILIIFCLCIFSPVVFFVLYMIFMVAINLHSDKKNRERNIEMTKRRLEMTRRMLEDLK